jgi:glycerol-3-phosphate cytidylyltransferase-like family protein
MLSAANDRRTSAPMFRVYTDIVGDLFHGGHVSFFERVREKATAIAEDRSTNGVVPQIELVVGLMSDDEAAAYKRQPVLTLAERTRVVEACRHVDIVIPGCPAKVNLEFIADNHISLVVHGDDFDEPTMRKHYDVPIDLGIFATVPYSNDPGRGEVTTTAIIERIVSREALR